MSKRLAYALPAGALTVIAALLFLQTFEVRNFPGIRFGAEIWPRAIIVCLGTLSVLLLVQTLRHAGDRPAPDLRTLAAREGIAFAVFACFFCFLWLTPRIGAYPAGGLFVFAVLTVLGANTVRATLVNMFISVMMTALLWVIFTHVLKVIAPSGRWWALI